MKNRHTAVSMIAALTLLLFGCSSSDSPSASDPTAATVAENPSVETPTIDPNDTRAISGLWQHTEFETTFFHFFENGNAIRWGYRGLAGPNCYLATRSVLTNLGNDRYQFFEDDGSSSIAIITVDFPVLSVTGTANTQLYLRRDDVDPNFIECPPGT